MKRFSVFTSAVLCTALLLTTGCYVNYPSPQAGQTEEQSQEVKAEKAEQSQEVKAEKAEEAKEGKFEMSEEVPPAPGDEEAAQKQEEPVQKQEQEEPAQKQTQSQKQAQKI